MAQRLTMDIVQKLDFQRVFYLENAHPGAMGNAGGLVLEVLEPAGPVRYETNMDEDAGAWHAVMARLKEQQQHYDSHYGGYGNFAYSRKDALITIDEQDQSFTLDADGKPYRFKSSVPGVFMAIVASMKRARAARLREALHPDSHT